MEIAGFLSGYAFLVALGGGIAVISYAIASYRNGLNKAEQDLIGTLKKSIDQLKETDITQSQELLRFEQMHKFDQEKLKLLMAVLKSGSPAMEIKIDELVEKADEAIAFLSNPQKELFRLGGGEDSTNATTT